MYARLRPYEQRHFIDEVIRLTGHSHQQLAERCRVTAGTVVTWHNEEHSIPYSTLLRLSEISGAQVPEVQEFFTYNPNPNPQPRLPRTITKPPLSPELAEFIGIMLGDGSLNRNRLMVCLNAQYEVVYAQFISDLINQLFGGIPTIQLPVEGARNSLTITLSSVETTGYLQEFGLIFGNKVKQQCSIPEWIFEDIELVRACVRGMIDTDGCVYHHAYFSYKKVYHYVKMTYAGRSRPLMEGLQRMLRILGYKPGSIRHPGYMSISSDRAVRRYYEQEVGTHNIHHWRRYKEALAIIAEYRKAD